jgi:hypothetical protein
MCLFGSASATFAAMCSTTLVLAAGALAAVFITAFATASVAAHLLAAFDALLLRHPASSLALY